jgi:hypothetical protein
VSDQGGTGVVEEDVHLAPLQARNDPLQGLFDLGVTLLGEQTDAIEHELVWRW